MKKTTLITIALTIATLGHAKTAAEITALINAEADIQKVSGITDRAPFTAIIETNLEDVKALLSMQKDNPAFLANYLIEVDKPLVSKAQENAYENLRSIFQRAAFASREYVKDFNEIAIMGAMGTQYWVAKQVEDPTAYARLRSANWHVGSFEIKDKLKFDAAKIANDVEYLMSFDVGAVMENGGDFELLKSYVEWLSAHGKKGKTSADSDAIKTRLESCELAFDNKFGATFEKANIALNSESATAAEKTSAKILIAKYASLQRRIETLSQTHQAQYTERKNRER